MVVLICFILKINSLKIDIIKFIFENHCLILKLKIFFSFFFFLFLLNLIQKKKKKISHIHIAFALNNNYIYPPMVSIASILSNSKSTSFIHFHLLISEDFENINRKKILTLKKIYIKSNFRFYNIGYYFKGWIHGKNRTVSAFYRVILGEIINKNIDKIIYLDGDTLIYNDLSEMYELNMNNLYFRGVHEVFYNRKDSNNKYICDGVMLMNIKLLKKENAFEKFRNYYFSFYKKGIYFDDQSLINILLKKKIK